jgi:hypothetical protein
MCIGLHVKYPLLNVLARFSRTNTQISNFMKIPPVGGELYAADGRIERRTNMTKLIVAFLNFANAPKNYCLKPQLYQRILRLPVNICTRRMTLHFPCIYLGIRSSFGGPELLVPVSNILLTYLLTYFLTYLLHGAQSFLRS